MSTTFWTFYNRRDGVHQLGRSLLRGMCVTPTSAVGSYDMKPFPLFYLCVELLKCHGLLYNLLDLWATDRKFHFFFSVVLFFILLCCFRTVIQLVAREKLQPIMRHNLYLFNPFYSAQDCAWEWVCVCRRFGLFPISFSTVQLVALFMVFSFSFFRLSSSSPKVSIVFNQQSF